MNLEALYKTIYRYQQKLWYTSLDIRGAYDKFPDIFRIGI